MLLSQPPVDFHWLRVGHCRQLEALARTGGAWRPVEFGSYCAAIRHPDRGWVLFDTGYAEHFHTATARLPGWLYGKLLPVTLPPGQTLTTQLATLGTHPSEIGTLVLSHFHGDHIAGLRDLPAARVYAASSGAAQALSLRGMAAVRHGLLPGLLPPDLPDRIVPTEDQPPVSLSEGLVGFDLFGDRSLVAIDLPGHTPGHLGLLLTAISGTQLLLSGDAAWSTKSFQRLQQPARMTRAGFDDPRKARHTLRRLHNLDRRFELTILPSHCAEGATAWAQPAGRNR